MRAERDIEPRVLHDDKNGTQLVLLYPDMLANEQAREEGQPNATSAVVLLSVGSRRILFPGDATMAEWQGIYRLAGGRPIECDVMAVPHHGALLGSAAEQDWLYTEAVRAESAVISVGTVSFRLYGHPRPEVIAAIRRAGSQVICTQITEQCCATLESLRPGIIRPMTPAQSSPQTDVNRRGYSRNVACASTVVIHVLPDQVEIARILDHQRAVDALASSGAGKPMCRCAG